VEEICADTEAWVKSLPSNIKAMSTLVKPKTAFDEAVHENAQKTLHTSS
jgi:hypothetical protein